MTRVAGALINESAGLGNPRLGNFRRSPFIVGAIFVLHYFCGMKNITITLPEEVARWLRVKAAENERSVSEWLAELLEEMQRREDKYEVAMKRFLARKPWKMEWVDGCKPTREELHDRTTFR